MGYDEELKKALHEKKIRKALSDNVNIKYPRFIVHSLQWVSVGYSSALFFGGKKVGKEILAPELKSKDIKDVLKDVGSFFESQGVGKFEIKEITDASITVRIKDSTTSYGMAPVGKPVCFFEAGIIAGIVEGRLGKNVVVNEVLCGGLGDDVDEFLIKLK